LLLLLFLAQAPNTSAQTRADLIERYLRINIYQQDSSRLVLKETYQCNRSKDSEYTKKYLSEREEYDVVGRTSLHLYYDPEGEMLSKIIRFYPAPRTEKGVFQQKDAPIDSVLYLYDSLGQRRAEYWRWGDGGTSDTVLYRYNDQYQLNAVYFNYLGKFRRDSLVYKSGLLERVWTFDAANKLQRELEFFYLDTLLLKITHRNARRLITEEEFFFYNSAGKPERVMSKLYAEGKNGDDDNSTGRITEYKYRRRSGIIKTETMRLRDKNRRTTATTRIRYDRYGAPIHQHQHSRASGIDEQVWYDYTRRRQ